MTLFKLANFFPEYVDASSVLKLINFFVVKFFVCHTSYAVLIVG